MSKVVVTCTWADVPHLSEDEQQSLLASIQPYQRDARTKGVPQLGSGAVYGFPEDDLKVKDFEIPAHWTRGYGMDVGGGAKPTAALWGALDKTHDILYVISAYKSANPEPALHAASIKARGQQPGVADSAALIVTAHDAEQLIAVYKRLGLDIELPDKAFETGIQEVWNRISTGRLKVFASCGAFFEEFRLYRRDKHGRVVKENDHLMDCLRYLVLSGLKRFKVLDFKRPTIAPPKRPMGPPPKSGGMRWAR
jgi:hypothetical protein